VCISHAKLFSSKRIPGVMFVLQRMLNFIFGHIDATGMSRHTEGPLYQAAFQFKLESLRGRSSSHVCRVVCLGDSEALTGLIAARGST
jgi:hypothetical protein